MLKQFTCDNCGTIDMIVGGSSHHLCNPCKVLKGLPLWRSPQKEAHFQVARAKRFGLLPSARNYQCVDCAAPAIEYDHRDYSKPLQVEPVCRRCNLARGSAMNHN